MPEHLSHPTQRDSAGGLRLLTLSEAAGELRRTERTLRRWRQLGLLRAVRIGAGIYITWAEIERLLDLPEG